MTIAGAAATALQMQQQAEQDARQEQRRALRDAARAHLIAWAVLPDGKAPDNGVFDPKTVTVQTIDLDRQRVIFGDESANLSVVKTGPSSWQVQFLPAGQVTGDGPALGSLVDLGRVLR